MFLEIRLTGADEQRRGRLEVFYNNEWGTVCDDKFGRREGEVVCRQLGFKNAEVNLTYKLPDSAPDSMKVSVNRHSTSN